MSVHDVRAIGDDLLSLIESRQRRNRLRLNDDELAGRRILILLLMGLSSYLDEDRLAGYDSLNAYGLRRELENSINEMVSRKDVP